MNKPFAESCEQNREPIFAVLQRLFADRRRVLEVGSGTGQHAAYFAPELPHLLWQPTDVAEHLPGIRAWCEEAGVDNIAEPVSLDVCGEWPEDGWDAAFSANTVHIMGWPEVECLFAGLGRVLSAPGALFALYGPFNYDGCFTSDSNARFDQWLKSRDPKSGIRDVVDLNRLAETAGLHPEEDIPMPANNRILVWRKS